MQKHEEDKGIVYSSRVLLGNWYETAKLEEVSVYLPVNKVCKTCFNCTYLSLPGCFSTS